MPEKYGKGVITIAFDDAYLDTCKHAIRYLSSLKLRSTIAVPALLVGRTLENRRVAGIKELRDCISNCHEIASHGLKHVNLLRMSLKDREEAVSEIAESKEKIGDLLGYNVNSFVFPYIHKNLSKLLVSKTRSYYESVRITSDSPCFNKIPLKSPRLLRGFAVMKKHSLLYLNKQVDHAAEKRLWLIEVFHLVAKKNTPSAHRPKPYRFFMHVDDFKRHVDHILSKNIIILTQKDAVRHGI